MRKAPRGIRLVIAMVGNRNTGKSSLINALTEQEIAIVSEIPGTTTDPVAKPYELIPIGPVTFYDTAGLDDTGELGRMRIRATRKILWRSDLAIVVAQASGLNSRDKEIISEIRELEIPFLIVFNKIDLFELDPDALQYCRDQMINHISVSAKTKQDVDKLREMIISIVPQEYKKEQVLAGDLFGEGDTVVLVVPIDLSAPKGRLILPQVQVIREILDSDAVAVVVKERELDSSLNNLNRKPALVIK